MCGIAGFLDNRLKREGFTETTKQMLSTLLHRGPDDIGVWVEGEVALGHCRLSILDLSLSGHQPMVSLSGRYVLAFNGEIYNHAALRVDQELRGWRFAGHSDTEILLSLIEDFGLEKSLAKCVGMFAIVVWDRKTRSLQLARDRFGEKPLYYGWHKGCFLFGSELKALMVHPTYVRDVDRDALALLFSSGYIPSPYCIFKNTFKLLPGNILTLTLPCDLSCSLTSENCQQKVVAYWSVIDVTTAGIASPFNGSFADATNELESLLNDAVKIQMQADVPLGAFLSGGIDSSTIVALMQHQSARPVKTFSIGFENSRFDEARFAKSVASYLGTEHTEMYVAARDALNVIPLLSSMYDEPLGDSSQIPTYLVAKMARQRVAVSLSGDGGDEVFCGYPRYAYGNLYARLPCRHSLLNIIGRLSWAAIAGTINQLAPSRSDNLKSSRLALRLNMLTAPSNQVAAYRLAMIYRDSRSIVAEAINPPVVYDSELPTVFEKNYLQLAMLMDKLGYLPDDILMKVDRATMSVSLESRAPFLDHRISEFVSCLPSNYLFDGRKQKRILREVLYRHVPKSLIERPKCGFSIPLADWLREDLRDWSMDLLSSDSFSGLLDMQRCRELFHIHNRGQQDLSLINWTVLSFLSWAHRWL